MQKSSDKSRGSRKYYQVAIWRRVTFYIAFTFFCSCTTVQSLPPSSAQNAGPIVKIRKKGYDGLTSAAQDGCADFKVSENEVEAMFKTYRPITGRVLRTEYIWSPCFVEGTVEEGGKTFIWRARAGHTLETNYPYSINLIMGEAPIGTPAE